MPIIVVVVTASSLHTPLESPHLALHRNRDLTRIARQTRSSSAGARWCCWFTCVRKSNGLRVSVPPVSVSLVRPSSVQQQCGLARASLRVARVVSCRSVRISVCIRRLRYRRRLCSPDRVIARCSARRSGGLSMVLRTRHPHARATKDTTE